MDNFIIACLIISLKAHNPGYYIYFINNQYINNIKLIATVTLLKNHFNLIHQR